MEIEPVERYVTNGRLKIGVYDMRPVRSEFSLCIEEDNKVNILGSFNCDKAARLFLIGLSMFCGGLEIHEM